MQKFNFQDSCQPNMTKANGLSQFIRQAATIAPEAESRLLS